MGQILRKGGKKSNAKPTLGMSHEGGLIKLWLSFCQNICLLNSCITLYRTDNFGHFAEFFRTKRLHQARRHGGAFRGRAPQMTACAPPTENFAPPQARTVPRRN